MLMSRFDYRTNRDVVCYWLRIYKMLLIIALFMVAAVASRSVGIRGMYSACFSQACVFRTSLLRSLICDTQVGTRVGSCRLEAGSSVFVAIMDSRLKFVNDLKRNICHSNHQTTDSTKESCSPSSNRVPGFCSRIVFAWTVPIGLLLHYSLGYGHGTHILRSEAFKRPSSPKTIAANALSLIFVLLTLATATRFGQTKHR